METGKHSPGMFVVLAGEIRVTGRDGHGHDSPVVDHRPGMFSGELAQVTGAPSFVDGVAVGEVEAILIEPAIVVPEPDVVRTMLLGHAGIGAPNE